MVQNMQCFWPLNYYKFYVIKFIMVWFTVHFEYRKHQVDILCSANNTYLFGLRKLFGEFILYVYS